MHYIPKGEFPVGTSDIEGFNPSSQSKINEGKALKTRLVYNGSIKSGTFIGLYNGNVTYSDTGSFEAVGGIYPSNLWSKNTNSAYSTAVYLFKRIS